MPSSFDAASDPQKHAEGTKGVFGQDVAGEGIKSYTSDPNAFHYGGQAGGATAQANTYQQQGNAMAGRAAPTIDTSRADQAADLGLGARSSQADALAMQRNAATGATPSVAEMQMQSGSQDAIRSQMAQAASARGPAGLAMAGANAAGNVAALQQNNAFQTSQLRAGEMANARNAYEAGATGIRAGDLASQTQGANQANAQAGMELAQRNLNQTGQISSEGMANDVNNAELNAQVQGQKIGSDNYNQAQKLFYDTQNANAERDQKTGGGLFGGALSAIGSVAGGLMGSDERIKEDIVPEGRDAMDVPTERDAGQARSGGGSGYQVGRTGMTGGGSGIAGVQGGGGGGSAWGDAIAKGFSGAGQAISMSDRALKEGVQLERAPMAYGAGISTGARPGEAGISAGTGHAAPGIYVDGMRSGESAKQADAAIAQSIHDQGKGAPSEMLEHLTPYSYNYKPGSGEDPSRRRYGVMAQDLERSPMGASIVEETPRGKAIDAGKAAGVNLAAMADLHQRLRAVEEQQPPKLAYGAGKTPSDARLKEMTIPLGGVRPKGGR